MDLTHITKLAEKQLYLEARVSNAEDVLKLAQEDLRTVAEVDLPEAMDAIGMEDFTLDDGTKIKCARKIVAAISKEHEEEAFDWLRANKAGGIIKREISVQFGKGEDELAKTVSELVHAAAPKQKKSDKDTVHWATLRKFVNECLADGIEIPLETFGVHEILRADITRANV